MICLNCGSEFEGHKRKFCNRTCGKRYNNRKNKGRDVSVYEVEPPISNNKPVTLNCLNCYKEFRRTKNGGSSGTEYTAFCSRRCGAIYAGNIIREKSAIKRLSTNRKSRIKKRAIAIRNALANEIKNAHIDAKHNHCRKCGAGITQDSARCCKRYCDKCKVSRIEEYKRNQRKLGLSPLGNDRARAKHYGVEYEPIKRKIVFDSYGWRCADCGVDTPKNMKGMNQDNSPELDHIIPISRGGPHVYANVQLLCRKCNASKSDSV